MSCEIFTVIFTLHIFDFHSSIHQVQSQVNLANNIEILYYSDKVEYICKVEDINQISWSLEASDVLITLSFFPAFHSQGRTQVDTLLSYTITASLTSVSNSSIVSTLTLPLAPTINGAIITCNGMSSTYNSGKDYLCHIESQKNKDDHLYCS